MYNLLRQIKMAFTYIDVKMVNKLIVSMIRPKLEYAQLMWPSHKKKVKRKLDQIQSVATKVAPGVRN